MNKRIWFLTFFILAVILACFPIIFSKKTANNDLYIQLLAGDGILSGDGWGYYMGEEFHRVSERAPSTRFSPGISLLAAAIKGLGLDPLICLVSMYPLIFVLSFLILALALSKETNTQSGFILAFLALTPLSVLESHIMLASEPFALIFAIILFIFVIKGPRLRNGYGFFITTFQLVVIAWFLIMIRNAMILLIAGALLAYSFIWIKGFWKKIGYFSLSLILCSAPMLILDFDIFTGFSSKKKLLNFKQILKTFRYFLKELNANIAILAEAIMPRLLHFFQYQKIIILIGWGILIFSSLVILIRSIYNRRKKASNLIKTVDSFERIATVSLIMTFTYIILLAIAATFFKYPWSSIYRVQGFILPWATFGFWSIILSFPYPDAFRKVVLLLILLLAFGRFSYGCFMSEHTPKRGHSLKTTGISAIHSLI